jgi:sugar O-acyltransferase (sialic acid O-acetyltransferase NeuD family)
MKRNLIVVGDSSFAEVACEYFTRAGRYEVLAFAVHRSFLKRTELLGRPVVALEDVASQFPPHSHSAFVAVTYRELNQARARLVAEMASAGFELATFVSDDAFVWPGTKIGRNCFIFEQNVIQPFVEIGDNVILWSGNHIGHHSAIRDNAFIASHVVVSGHVTIGANSFLGVNSTIADTTSVGADNWIGPGALITQDTEAGQIYRAPPSERSKVSAYRFFKVPQPKND